MDSLGLPEEMTCFKQFLLPCPNNLNKHIVGASEMYTKREVQMEWLEIVLIRKCLFERISTTLFLEEEWL